MDVLERERGADSFPKRLVWNPLVGQDFDFGSAKAKRLLPW